MFNVWFQPIPGCFLSVSFFSSSMRVCPVLHEPDMSIHLFHSYRKKKAKSIIYITDALFCYACTQSVQADSHSAYTVLIVVRDQLCAYAICTRYDINISKNHIKRDRLQISATELLKISRSNQKPFYIFNGLYTHTIILYVCMLKRKTILQSSPNLKRK